MKWFVARAHGLLNLVRNFLSACHKFHFCDVNVATVLFLFFLFEETTEGVRCKNDFAFHGGVRIAIQGPLVSATFGLASVAICSCSSATLALSFSFSSTVFNRSCLRSATSLYDAGGGVRRATILGQLTFVVVELLIFWKGCVGPYAGPRARVAAGCSSGLARGSAVALCLQKPGGIVFPEGADGWWAPSCLGIRMLDGLHGKDGGLKHCVQLLSLKGCSPLQRRHFGVHECWLSSEVLPTSLAAAGCRIRAHVRHMFHRSEARIASDFRVRM